MLRPPVDQQLRQGLEALLAAQPARVRTRFLLRQRIRAVGPQVRGVLRLPRVATPAHVTLERFLIRMDRRHMRPQARVVGELL